MTRPPVSYRVSLDDLVTIADAACELDGMRMHYVDRPDEQQRIAGLVDKLHSMVERAAAQDTALIYGPDDGAHA